MEHLIEEEASSAPQPPSSPFSLSVFHPPPSTLFPPLEPLSLPLAKTITAPNHESHTSDENLIFLDGKNSSEDPINSNEEGAECVSPTPTEEANLKPGYSLLHGQRPSFGIVCPPSNMSDTEENMEVVSADSENDWSFVEETNDFLVPNVNRNDGSHSATSSSPVYVLTDDVMTFSPNVSDDDYVDMWCHETSFYDDILHKDVNINDDDVNSVGNEANAFVDDINNNNPLMVDLNDNVGSYRASPVNDPFMDCLDTDVMDFMDGNFPKTQACSNTSSPEISVEREGYVPSTCTTSFFKLGPVETICHLRYTSWAACGGPQPSSLELEEDCFYSTNSNVMDPIYDLHPVRDTSRKRDVHGSRERKLYREKRSSLWC